MDNKYQPGLTSNAADTGYEIGIDSAIETYARPLAEAIRAYLDSDQIGSISLALRDKNRMRQALEVYDQQVSTR